MPKRTGLLLDSSESTWKNFLEEFLEDTPSSINHFDNTSDACDFFGRKGPDFAFINASMMSQALGQKLKVQKTSMPHFRVFEINQETPTKSNSHFEESFLDPPLLQDFRRMIVEKLPLPDQINIIIIDDEPEIGNMVNEYLGNRIRPSFDVRYAENGKKGLEMIGDLEPHVLLLDIKMPIMDGFEVYRTIKKKGYTFSVIVFFDAIMGDEMQEISRIGKPAVVEKGSRESSMPELMSLIKKLAYFG